jgi:hypothetical protein
MPDPALCPGHALPLPPRVERRALTPIDLAEIITDGVEREQVLVFVGDGQNHRRAGQFRAAACAQRVEDGDDAVAHGPPPLAVAAAGGLGDLVEPCLGSPDPRPRKVEIDTSLHERGRDQSAGKTVREAPAHILKDPAAIGSVLTGRQMHDAVEPGIRPACSSGQGTASALFDRSYCNSLHLADLFEVKISEVFMIVPQLSNGVAPSICPSTNRSLRLEGTP